VIARTEGEADGRNKDAERNNHDRP
jgi:hypothetical protein